MALATRIIPTLLAKGDQLVKGKQFQSWRTVGHVLQAAMVHAKRGVDELIILDITATPAGRGPNLELVEKLSKPMFTPITVGGGVRSVDDVRDLLKAGADKVAIKTHWEVIPGASAKFGKQAIVAALDVADDGWNWRSSAQRARELEALGAGEILLTSIPREGTMEGYDLKTIATVSASVDIPVIAHGGCGTALHMREAIDAGASAVAAGAMFAFTDITPRDCAKLLAEDGIEVRL